MAKALNQYSKANIVIPDTPNTKMFLDLSRTDPSATKPFQKEGGFRGTSIDPAWRFMRLTEYFGPCGQGWGAEQVAFHIVEGVAFVCMRFWYRVPNPDGSMGTGEQCWTAPQWGGSKLVKVDNKGKTTISDEALKMAATDALGKCAAMFLGLSADVYLGSFEDDKYRDESEAFYSAKANPDLQKAAIEKYEADLKEKLDAVEDLDALDDIWKSGANARIREIGSVDKAAKNRMISAFSQKKNEILKKAEARTEEPAGQQEPPPPPPASAPKPFRPAPPPAQPNPPAQAAAAPSNEDVEKAETTIASIKKLLDDSGTLEDASKVWVTRKGKQAFMKAIKVKLLSFDGATDVSEYWKSDIDRLAGKVKTISEDDALAIWQAISDRRETLIDGSSKP